MNEWWCGRNVRSRFYVRAGGGQLPPNLSLAPQMCWLLQHMQLQTVIPGASLAFKICQNAFPSRALPQTALGSLRRSRRPLVGWAGETQVSLPNKPYSTWRFLRLDSRARLDFRVGGHCPQIFSSRTAPRNVCRLSCDVLYTCRSRMELTDL